MFRSPVLNYCSEMFGLSVIAIPIGLVLWFFLSSILLWTWIAAFVIAAFVVTAICMWPNTAKRVEEIRYHDWDQARMQAQATESVDRAYARRGQYRDAQGDLFWLEGWNQERYECEIVEPEERAEQAHVRRIQQAEYAAQIQAQIESRKDQRVQQATRTIAASVVTAAWLMRR